MPENLPQQHKRPNCSAIEQEQLNTQQVYRSLKETMLTWLPLTANAFLFEFIVVVYLFVAVVHFFKAGDISMFLPLLSYAAAYAGIEKLTPLLLTRRENNNQPLSKAEQIRSDTCDAQ